MVGLTVGLMVGEMVGLTVGLMVGETVGLVVGLTVGLTVGCPGFPFPGKHREVQEAEPPAVGVRATSQEGRIDDVLRVPSASPMSACYMYPVAAKYAGDSPLQRGITAPISESSRQSSTVFGLTRDRIARPSLGGWWMVDGGGG